jgi:glycosyltransferase involved in cell wall biosynthesis
VTPPLRVALVGLIAAGYSGVPRYAAALTRALDEVAGEFPDVRLTLVTTRAGAEAVAARTLAVRDLPLRGRHAEAGPGRIALEQLASPLARADLLHFFDTTGPVLAPWRRFVATVHDASVFRGLRPAKHSYKRRLWPWAVRRATALVAVSEYAKAEAVEQLGAEPARVHVIRSGPGFAAATGAPADGGGGHFLYVGALSASKNLPFLIEAFDASGAPADLVLAGRPGQDFPALAAAVEGAARRDRIRLVHDASDAELDRLYRSALALVHPSLYEGFGFTPLEAMARGCPVLASDIPAVREISGDGALLVPLEDRAAWAGSLARLATDPALRQELRARGASTVARYSWTATARELCGLFRRVGRRGAG